jgi:hypothetical protein
MNADDALPGWDVPRGSVRFVQKPFFPEVLLEEVRTVLCVAPPGSANDSIRSKPLSGEAQ